MSKSPLYLLNYLITVMDKKCPHIIDACEPKRVVPPNGYASSRHIAAIMSSHMIYATDPELCKGVTRHTILVSDYLCLKHDNPMFFCREGFLRAVAETNLPDSFKGTDLKWPHPCVMFMLPLKWSQAYFGYPVPYMTAGFITEPVKCPIEGKLGGVMPIVDTTKPRLVLHQSVMIGGNPIDYTYAWPLDDEIQRAGVPSDFSNYKEFSEDLGYYDNVPLPTMEQEKVMVAAMNALTLQILLAITARPELVERGECVRKAKTKHGRIKDALWSPNMIGKNYTASMADGNYTLDGGDHYRPHWRRGHFRKQHHGKGNILTKIIWLEPVLVNSELLEK